jgi:hypothetical protein
MTSIPNIGFKDLRGHEGLVFVGCGGDLEEWTTGIKLLLPADCQGIFGDFSLLVTSGGRHDLVLPFLDGAATPMSLVSWRLRFGDCSWISDYLVNYRDHHLQHHLHPCVAEQTEVKVHENVQDIDHGADAEEQNGVNEQNDENEHDEAQTAIKRARNAQAVVIPRRRPKRRLFLDQ